MPTITNPALKDLNVLVGTWNVEIASPAEPSNVARLHVAFEWMENGAFLLMRLPAESSGPAQSFWMMGRDESAAIYTVLYADKRGVSRIYQMTLENGVWKMWRDAPGFSQRYTGTLSADKRVIQGRWEKSGDGSQWEHDFDITYVRAQ